MMQNAATLESRQPSHVFGEGQPLAERKTRWVVWLTATIMVAEINGGWSRLRPEAAARTERGT